MRCIGQALVIVALSTSVIAAMRGELVTDESIRLDILRAAFPNALMSVSQGKPLNWQPDPWPEHNLTDALHGEREYTVIGTLDHSEQAWVSLYGEGSTPDPNPARRLRMKVYAVGSGDRKTYVALAQYDIFFTHKLWKRLSTDSAFARLFLLTKQTEDWRVDHTNDSLIQGRKAIPSFRVFDINGDGQDEIMVEAEGSTAHRRWITMTILGITDGRLHRLAEVETGSTTVDFGDT